MGPWTLPDALNLLHSQYPGAVVTSGFRSPNSALGRANPRSYHNIGEAFDVKPMQGVSFGDYVSKLKSAGLPVVESLDEASHPAFDTTGPNWHIAFQGNKQVATSPIDLLRRAQLFNVNIPQGDPSQAAAAPQAAPAAMPAPGFDISKALAALTVPDAPKQSKRGSILATILGSLSDGLSVLGRGQPMYAQLAAQQRSEDQNADLAREKLQSDMAMQKLSLLAKLQEQPAFVQDFQAFNGMDPATKRQFLQYKDAVSPVEVSTPQGTQNVPRTSSKVINGKTYYNVGGDWYEEGN